MAVRARPLTPTLATPPRRFRLPLEKLLVVIMTIVVWEVAHALPGWLQSRSSVLAPLFTPQVNHWSGDIARWSGQYGLDPNLLATVMQIESCGHPTVSSHAGAQGLFQVMPFHFQPGEDMLDPDTNARRGASFLEQCLNDFAGGDPGLAMACYNGGPSVTRKPFTQWPNETQRYYIWGMGIYTDARANASTSQTLNEWLGAGGSGLCERASAAQGS
ncbi:MAG: transglycosylase SLT domain-containing protein [Anaerolineae bacterium]|nr:transglycosylase SLT domain-containing protein [Anaerolineae bacterium]